MVTAEDPLEEEEVFCGTTLSTEMAADSVAHELAEQPSPRNDGIGNDTEAPDGITTVSECCCGGCCNAEVTATAAAAAAVVAAATIGELICWTTEADGCEAIASCRSERTSSALAKSKGVWFSWFFRKGSAPCAS